MMRPMILGEQIQAWRLVRQESVESVAEKAGMSVPMLAAIESGTADPTASTLDAIARALALPCSWLFGHPRELRLLIADDDEPDSAEPAGVDPVLERMLVLSREHRELYLLLTSLLERGEPKLWRAAEVSLRSLLKQARTPTVPWQSRPSGHFEPPSD